MKLFLRIWNWTLDAFLIQNGFKRCAVEPTLYMKDGLILLIYVDDLFYICKDEEKFEAFEADIKKRFEVEIKLEPNRFLGFNLKKVQEVLKLT